MKTACLGFAVLVLGNIGAFFSGIASTSLHGWLWIAAALPGCWVGLWLQRRLRQEAGV